jgi:hypothetical protein
MTGKHVKPSAEGEAQPKRSGLALGLSLLTLLLCVAVLFLSANRHRDKAVRAQIEARAAELVGYAALAEPVQIPLEPEIELSEARVVGAVRLRPPSDAWALGESTVAIAGVRYQLGVISNAFLRVEFLCPAEADWGAGLREAIQASPYLELPTRHGERALVDMLFSTGIEEVQEHVARPRQRISLAETAFETLRVRCESPQIGRGRWRAPRPVALPGFTGYVELATEERPVVSVLIFDMNKVIAEAIVSRVDRDTDEDALAELNERWWEMLYGVEGSAARGVSDGSQQP